MPRRMAAVANVVTIYSDGACLGNPGPGGYGTVMLAGDHRRELSAGFKRTTNNRMELLGAIVGLEALKRPCTVTVFSDSQYVVNAFVKDWIAGWEKRGWKTASKQPVKNQDLWQRLLRAVEPHKVAWQWVRGHDGNVENERCDVLAVAAANDRANHQDDAGFIESEV